MNYKDYIKDEYCDIYVRERDNLADRIIEKRAGSKSDRLSYYIIMKSL